MTQMLTENQATAIVMQEYASKVSIDSTIGWWRTAHGWLSTGDSQRWEQFGLGEE
jgi:hypothetical protein